MKVFNTKVDRCPMVGPLKYGSSFCNMQKENGIGNEIHSDCPFSKPITKEVIEGFGFEGQATNSTYFKMEGYRLVHWVKPGQEIDIYKIFYDGEEQLIFRGSANNPEELEFILRAIGILEDKRCIWVRGTTATKNTEKL